MSTNLDELVAATPTTRDRSVDLLRAFSIVVVVLWHWVFSVTHWNTHGALTMPNPIGHVPALWFLTWVLQIMPLFFFVGGFANSVAWKGDTRAFLATRLQRLLRPIGVYLAVWTGFEVLARLAIPGYAGVLHWGFVVFVPLWFLGVYTAVVLLTPLTMRLHRRAPVRTIVAIGTGVALVDLVRFQTGIDAVGMINVLLAFLFVHQLGFFYGEGSLTRCSRRVHWAMLGGAVVVLLALTTFGPYPYSMVTVDSEAGSNMLPTTMCIAVLGVLQAAIALLLRPALNRWLAHRRPWKAVVFANSMAMTVFTWHMTAYVIAVGIMSVFGVGLMHHATSDWWYERPLWLLLPGVILAGCIAVFGRFETRTRRG